MSTRNDTGSRVNFLTVLAALIVLCLAGAAALTMFARNTPAAAPTAELSLVVQRIPFEAQNALRGESSAFDALAKSAARLKALRGANAGMDVPAAGSGAAESWAGSESSKRADPGDESSTSSWTTTYWTRSWRSCVSTSPSTVGG